MTEILRSSNTPTSPFETIRRIGADGREFWSARELMPLLGYSKWERFDDAIDRAVAACRNSGIYAGDEFLQVTQLPGAGNLGEQRRNDYRLSRYACYLVAMNGDPRKPQIAAAQTYFAVKTREAEVRDAIPQIPATYAEALRAAAEQAERAELAERHAAELEPAAQAWDTLSNATGDFSLREAAQILSRDPSVPTIGQNRLLKYLREIGWVDRHSTPYQGQVDLGRLFQRTDTYDHPHTREPRLYTQVRITPKGLAELRNRLRVGAQQTLAGVAA